MSPVVDSHQHFWRLDRGDYAWLTPALAPIYRDYLPDQLAPQLAQAGVGSTILVQAAATVEETRFMLELARANPFIAGVVGWVDFEGDDVADVIAALAADPGLVGLRPMIQDIPDTEWMLRGETRAGLRSDDRPWPRVRCVGAAQHLPALLELAARYPDLTMVLDHGAKPPIAAGDLGPLEAVDHRTRAFDRPWPASSRAWSPRRTARRPRNSRPPSSTCSTRSARRA